MLKFLEWQNLWFRRILQLWRRHSGARICSCLHSFLTSCVLLYKYNPRVSYMNTPLYISHIYNFILELMKWCIFTEYSCAFQVILHYVLVEEWRILLWTVQTCKLVLSAEFPGSGESGSISLVLFWTKSNCVCNLHAYIQWHVSVSCAFSHGRVLKRNSGSTKMQTKLTFFHFLFFLRTLRSHWVLRF